MGRPVHPRATRGGLVLVGLFVRIEASATEPILPLRVLADRTRASANVARGLGYAGMYGIIFFLTQFLQDIQGHSALVTGVGFLPTPTFVFLSSQLTSRVLVNRLPAKALMVIGTTLSALGLALATQLHTGAPYPQVLASLVLIGTGMGVSFVSLTTAGLAGVARSDAGAASGLINVMQQLGAALGLAVLVTVFDSITSGAHTCRAQPGGRSRRYRRGGSPGRAGARHGRDLRRRRRLCLGRLSHRGPVCPATGPSRDRPAGAREGAGRARGCGLTVPGLALRTTRTPSRSHCPRTGRRPGFARCRTWSAGDGA